MSLKESLSTSANFGESETGSLFGSVIEMQTSWRDGSYAAALDADSTRISIGGLDVRRDPLPVGRCGARRGVLAFRGVIELAFRRGSQSFSGRRLATPCRRPTPPARA